MVARKLSPAFKTQPLLLSVFLCLLNRLNFIESVTIPKILDYLQHDAFKLLPYTLLLFMSCNDMEKDGNTYRLPENSKIVQMELIDSLGEISFSVPLRYDTNFSWVHYSDCGKPCDEQKYRIQPKGLPVAKESGWIWLGEPKDSIERFTISHTRYIPFHDGDTAKNSARHSQLKELLISDPGNPPVIFDTIQRINGRYYSIIAMGKSDPMYFRKVLAATTIKSNIIKFQYELLTNQGDSVTNNFIKNSIDLIKTFRVNNGI